MSKAPRSDKTNTPSSADSNQPGQDDLRDDLQDMLKNPKLIDLFKKGRFQVIHFTMAEKKVIFHNKDNKDYRLFLRAKNDYFAYSCEEDKNITMFHTALTWIKRGKDSPQAQFANHLCDKFLQTYPQATQHLKPFIDHARARNHDQPTSQASLPSYGAQSSTSVHYSGQQFSSANDFSQ